MAVMSSTLSQACAPEQENLALSVLVNIGPSAVLPAADAFISEAALLNTAVQDWRAAEASGQGADAAKAAAQEQWQTTVLAWQPLEVMQIGPASQMLTDPGNGQDLRDKVYSWPQSNSCRIDQEVVYAAWRDAGWFALQQPGTQGLDALEHLLFSGEANSCDAEADINQDGSWDALVGGGLSQNRAEMAAVLSEQVLLSGEALYDAWSPDGQGFSAQLSDAYDSRDAALNIVFDALFYLELVTKDRKLGHPMGLLVCEADDCPCEADTCPDDVEHRLSGTGAAAIEANLQGFRELFTGGSASGMDDLLTELGHGSLSDTLLTELDQAIVLAGGIRTPLDEAVAAGDDDLTLLYDEIKDVTDLLKNQVATVLRLQIPEEASGDLD
jgi:predicted lipoprotein